jgi:hypothetical protein
LDEEGKPTGKKVRPKSMLSVEEATNHYISTKSLFTLTFDGDQMGNDLQIFFRWINTKHPDLAGPWSSLFSRIIS